MKRINTILSVVAAAAGLAACNKVEFVTENFVCFTTNSVNIEETTEGVVAIPLNVYGVKEATVTYKVISGTDAYTAKINEDFEIVDKSGKTYTKGIVKVAADAAQSESIYLKFKYDPAKTKTKKFLIQLEASSTKGVEIRGTKAIVVNIMDLEDAVAKYYGNWATAKGDIKFELKEYDIDKDPDEIAEYYPNASLVISAGGEILDTEIAGDIYGYYDGKAQTINLYPYQAYNAYNFGGIGPHFVGLMSTTGNDNDIVLGTEGGKLTVVDGFKISLFTYPDGDLTKYIYDICDAGTVLEKQQ